MASPVPPPPPYAYAYEPRPPPLLHRHPRLLWWYSIIRPSAIIVPFVASIMVIWWFSTNSFCDVSASASDECYWALWLSLPLAIVSLVWNMAAMISHRRSANYRRGISSDIQLPVQFIIACGATVCLGMLAWHYAVYKGRMWGSHLEGSVIALVCIIM
ncbi:hypothetical protein ACO1O0_002487 [Amphichorda felina]